MLALAAAAFASPACRSSASPIEPIESSAADEAPAAGAPSALGTDPAASSGGPTPAPTASARAGGERQRWQSDLASPRDSPGAAIPLDDDLITRQLDNGVQLLIRPDIAPGARAQLWLVVDAGSVDEVDGAIGAAHFLEHMMFNGTSRFPGNEIVPILEGFGSAFGPDVNAHTGFAETVYKLTVPARDDAIELAVDVLREWASDAALERAAVEAERGVIREEYRRGRERAGGRLGEFYRQALLGDTPFGDRPPIGDLADIETMTAADLARFYDTWYRPERMTVIAVGDLDPGHVERVVTDRFGDLAARTPTPSRPSFEVGDGALAEPIVEVLTDPEVTRTDIDIVWRLPAVDVVNRSDLRRDLVARLAWSVIDTRLLRHVHAGTSGLLYAGATRASQGPLHASFGVDGVSTPATAAQDLAALLTVVEQVRQHPIDTAEFRDAVDRVLGGAEQRFAESPTRQDRAVAGELVDWALGGSAPLDPLAELEATRALLAEIRAVDVQRFVHDRLLTPPYVVVTGAADTADELPSPHTLASIVDDTVGWVVEPPRPWTDLPDDLMSPPSPAEVVETTTIDALDAFVVTYENGARLAFRPTTIVENSVEFEAWSRGGFFEDEGSVVPLLGRASSMVVSSGFESIDSVALESALAGASVAISARIDRAEETLSGEAGVDDLETLFQLIHLQMTEPALDDLEVRRFTHGWRPVAERPEASPTLAADVVLWNLRYGDSPYFRRMPSVADLDTLDPAAQLEAWKQHFANAGDFVFVFVGDVDRDRILELGQRYLGTLPGTPTASQRPPDRDPGIPQANLVETVAVGVGDRARLRINWESPRPFEQGFELAAEALEIVIDARLRDLVREELSAAYSPRATIVLLSEPKVWVDTIIEIDTDPDRIDEVAEAVHAELARIRDGDIDERYLELAVAQILEDERFFSNPEWIENIRFHLAHADRSADEHRRRGELARSLTVADLAEAATVVFPPERSVEVRMVPALD